MGEKTIDLTTIDPVILYGVNNTKLDIIGKYFTKLKIIARGNTIKIIGDDEETGYFENKLEAMIAHYDKYHNLTENNIRQILEDNTKGILLIDEDSNILLFGTNGRQIKAQNANQQLMVKLCNTNDLLFAIGPAGTGKTYIAVAMAVKALRTREVRKIILSRPAVEAGERLGYLPGDFKEKLDPYLQPLYDALEDMIPPRKLGEMIEDKTIQIAPLAFMRGRTLNNAFVVLDEAQNATTNQLKMFLTRMGENAKFIVTGDITQIDLPNRHNSGLLQTRRILRNIEGIAIVNFDPADIVRHKLVKNIVDAYDKELDNNEKTEEIKNLNNDKKIR